MNHPETRERISYAPTAAFDIDMDADSKSEREQRDTITPEERQAAFEQASSAAAEREWMEAELARIESWQRDLRPLRQLADDLANIIRDMPMAHSRETADVLFLVQRHVEIAVRALRLRIFEF